MHFGIFPCHLSKDSKVHAPATKKWPQVTRSAAPVTQNHLSKPEDLMLQSAAPQEISARTSQHVWPRCLVRLLGEMDLCRSSWNIPRRPSFLQLLQNPHVYLSHENDASISKSGPNVVWFLQFWFPHVLRTTATCSFSTSHFQKCSGRAVLLAFWLPNLFAAQPHERLKKCSEQEVFLTFWSPNAIFYLFARFTLLSSDFLFSDLLSYVFLFSDSSHLCCFICPYCRKFGF